MATSPSRQGATWTAALPGDMNKPGIYRITNTVNGKVYIGSSVNVEARWCKHLSGLRSGKHKNAHLQAAFSQYGEVSFLIEVLEFCDRHCLLKREQHYLDTIRPEYNILSVAGSSIGYRHDAIARQKMSQANMGNKRFLGRHHTAETKQKLSAAKVGTTLAPEHVSRIKEANRGNSHTLGHKLTSEHRAKVSSALQSQWDGGTRNRDAAAARARARWADPAWKAQQSARIAQGKAAKRAAAAHGVC